MTSTPPSDRDSALQILHDVTEMPAAYARSWKERTQRPVVGTFCSYVPEEVVVAAGALPFRILQVPGEFTRADACLQTYACCLARGVLELGLGGGAALLDGVVFGNTCDTMQCLADIWSANVDGGLVETFMMPVHVGHPASREYVAAEVQRLLDSLAAKLDTDIDPASLRGAVAECRQARQALADLQTAQRGASPILTAREYYEAMMARWILPPDEYAALVATVLGGPGPAAQSGPRVVVTGGPLYATVLPTLLDELGARWVGDDLCTGGRTTWSGEETEDEPVAAIADRLLSRPLCPAKHVDRHDPGRDVVDVARRAAASGVIVYRLKFCDPHAFDYPRIKQCLDEAGLANLLIEVETPTGATGQLRTRLQAFLEMLDDAPVVEAPR